ncbi:MAG: hypothetical protein HYS56_02910, partial [Candidatus Omnitrophica bacterium]|nr:hypothetical protein [Candidatus Omnitrophota bacterium]
EIHAAVETGAFYATEAHIPMVQPLITLVEGNQEALREFRDQLNGQEFNWYQHIVNGARELYLAGSFNWMGVISGWMEHSLGMGLLSGLERLAYDVINVPKTMLGFDTVDFGMAKLRENTLHTLNGSGIENFEEVAQLPPKEREKAIAESEMIQKIPAGAFGEKMQAQQGLQDALANVALMEQAREHGISRISTYNVYKSAMETLQADPEGEGDSRSMMRQFLSGRRGGGGSLDLPGLLGGAEGVEGAEGMNFEEADLIAAAVARATETLNKNRPWLDSREAIGDIFTEFRESVTAGIPEDQARSEAVKKWIAGMKAGDKDAVIAEQLKQAARERWSQREKSQPAAAGILPDIFHLFGKGKQEKLAREAGEKNAVLDGVHGRLGDWGLAGEWVERMFQSQTAAQLVTKGTPLQDRIVRIRQAGITADEGLVSETTPEKEKALTQAKEMEFFYRQAIERWARQYGYDPEKAIVVIFACYEAGMEESFIEDYAETILSVERRKKSLVEEVSFGKLEESFKESLAQQVQKRIDSLKQQGVTEQEVRKIEAASQRVLNQQGERKVLDSLMPAVRMEWAKQHTKSPETFVAVYEKTGDQEAADAILATAGGRIDKNKKSRAEVMKLAGQYQEWRRRFETEIGKEHAKPIALLYLQDAIENPSKKLADADDIEAVNRSRTTKIAEGVRHYVDRQGKERYDENGQLKPEFRKLAELIVKLGPRPKKERIEEVAWDRKEVYQEIAEDEGYEDPNLLVTTASELQKIAGASSNEQEIIDIAKRVTREIERGSFKGELPSPAEMAAQIRAKLLAILKEERSSAARSQMEEAVQTGKANVFLNLIAGPLLKESVEKHIKGKEEQEDYLAMLNIFSGARSSPEEQARLADQWSQFFFYVTRASEAGAITLNEAFNDMPMMFVKREDERMKFFTHKIIEIYYSGDPIRKEAAKNLAKNPETLAELENLVQIIVIQAQKINKGELKEETMSAEAEKFNSAFARVKQQGFSGVDLMDLSRLLYLQGREPPEPAPTPPKPKQEVAPREEPKKEEPKKEPERGLPSRPTPQPVSMPPAAAKATAAGSGPDGETTPERVVAAQPVTVGGSGGEDEEKKILAPAVVPTAPVTPRMTQLLQMARRGESFGVVGQKEAAALSAAQIQTGRERLSNSPEYAAGLKFFEDKNYPAAARAFERSIAGNENFRRQSEQLREIARELPAGAPDQGVEQKLKELQDRGVVGAGTPAVSFISITPSAGDEQVVTVVEGEESADAANQAIVRLLTEAEKIQSSPEEGRETLTEQWFRSVGTLNEILAGANQYLYAQMADGVPILVLYNIVEQKKIEGVPVYVIEFARLILPKSGIFEETFAGFTREGEDYSVVFAHKARREFDRLFGRGGTAEEYRKAITAYAVYEAQRALDNAREIQIDPQERTRRAFRAELSSGGYLEFTLARLKELQRLGDSAAGEVLENYERQAASGDAGQEQFIVAGPPTVSAATATDALTLEEADEQLMAAQSSLNAGRYQEAADALRAYGIVIGQVRRGDAAAQQTAERIYQRSILLVEKEKEIGALAAEDDSKRSVLSYSGRRTELREQMRKEDILVFHQRALRAVAVDPEEAMERVKGALKENAPKFDANHLESMYGLEGRKNQYGRASEAITVAIQAGSGLKLDGDVGQETWRTIRERIISRQQEEMRSVKTELQADIQSLRIPVAAPSREPEPVIQDQDIPAAVAASEPPKEPEAEVPAVTQVKRSEEHTSTAEVWGTLRGEPVSETAPEAVIPPVEKPAEPIPEPAPVAGPPAPAKQTVEGPAYRPVSLVTPTSELFKAAPTIDIHDKVLTSEETRQLSEAFQQGVAAARQKDFSRAAAFFKRAIEINPSEIAVYLWQGFVYLAMGEKDLAEASFSAAIELSERQGGERSSLTNRQIKKIRQYGEIPGEKRYTDKVFKEWLSTLDKIEREQRGFRSAEVKAQGGSGLNSYSTNFQQDFGRGQVRGTWTESETKLKPAMTKTTYGSGEIQVRPTETTRVGLSVTDRSQTEKTEGEEPETTRQTTIGAAVEETIPLGGKGRQGEPQINVKVGVEKRFSPEEEEAREEAGKQGREITGLPPSEEANVRVGIQNVGISGLSAELSAPEAWHELKNYQGRLAYRWPEITGGIIRSRGDVDVTVERAGEMSDQEINFRTTGTLQIGGSRDSRRASAPLVIDYTFGMDNASLDDTAIHLKMLALDHLVLNWDKLNNQERRVGLAMLMGGLKVNTVFEYRDFERQRRLDNQAAEIKEGTRLERAVVGVDLILPWRPVGRIRVTGETNLADELLSGYDYLPFVTDSANWDKVRENGSVRISLGGEVIVRVPMKYAVEFGWVNIRDSRTGLLKQRPSVSAGVSLGNVAMRWAYQGLNELMTGEATWHPWGKGENNRPVLGTFGNPGVGVFVQSREETETEKKEYVIGAALTTQPDFSSVFSWMTSVGKNVPVDGFVDPEFEQRLRDSNTESERTRRDTLALLPYNTAMAAPGAETAAPAGMKLGAALENAFGNLDEYRTAIRQYQQSVEKYKQAEELWKAGEFQKRLKEIDELLGKANKWYREIQDKAQKYDSAKQPTLKQYREVTTRLNILFAGMRQLEDKLGQLHQTVNDRYEAYEQSHQLARQQLGNVHTAMNNQWEGGVMAALRSVEENRIRIRALLGQFTESVVVSWNEVLIEGGIDEAAVLSTTAGYQQLWSQVDTELNEEGSGVLDKVSRAEAELASNYIGILGVATPLLNALKAGTLPVTEEQRNQMEGIKGELNALLTADKVRGWFNFFTSTERQEMAAVLRREFQLDIPENNSDQDVFVQGIREMFVENEYFLFALLIYKNYFSQQPGRFDQELETWGEILPKVIRLFHEDGGAKNLIYLAKNNPMDAFRVIEYFVAHRTAKNNNGGDNMEMEELTDMLDRMVELKQEVKGYMGEGKDSFYLDAPPLLSLIPVNVEFLETLRMFAMVDRSIEGVTFTGGVAAPVVGIGQTKALIAQAAGLQEELRPIYMDEKEMKKASIQWAARKQFNSAIDVNGILEAMDRLDDLAELQGTDPDDLIVLGAMVNRAGQGADVQVNEIVSRFAGRIREVDSQAVVNPKVTLIPWTIRFYKEGTGADGIATREDADQYINDLNGAKELARSLGVAGSLYNPVSKDAQLARFLVQLKQRGYEMTEWKNKVLELTGDQTLIINRNGTMTPQDWYDLAAQFWSVGGNSRQPESPVTPQVQKVGRAAFEEISGMPGRTQNLTRVVDGLKNADGSNSIPSLTEDHPLVQGLADLMTEIDPAQITDPNTGLLQWMVRIYDNGNGVSFNSADPYRYLYYALLAKTVSENRPAADPVAFVKQYDADYGRNLPFYQILIGDKAGDVKENVSGLARWFTLLAQSEHFDEPSFDRRLAIAAALYGQEGAERPLQSLGVTVDPAQADGFNRLIEWAIWAEENAVPSSEVPTVIAAAKSRLGVLTATKAKIAGIDNAEAGKIPLLAPEETLPAIQSPNTDTVRMIEFLADLSGLDPPVSLTDVKSFADSHDYAFISRYNLTAFLNSDSRQKLFAWSFFRQAAAASRGETVEQADEWVNGLLDQMNQLRSNEKIAALFSNEVNRGVDPRNSNSFLLTEALLTRDPQFLDQFNEMGILENAAGLAPEVSSLIGRAVDPSQPQDQALLIYWALAATVSYIEEGGARTHLTLADVKRHLGNMAVVKGRISEKLGVSYDLTDPNSAASQTVGLLAGLATFGEPKVEGEITTLPAGYTLGLIDRIASAKSGIEQIFSAKELAQEQIQSYLNETRMTRPVGELVDAIQTQATEPASQNLDLTNPGHFADALRWALVLETSGKTVQEWVEQIVNDVKELKPFLQIEAARFGVDNASQWLIQFKEAAVTESGAPEFGLRQMKQAALSRVRLGITLGLPDRPLADKAVQLAKVDFAAPIGTPEQWDQAMNSFESRYLSVHRQLTDAVPELFSSLSAGEQLDLVYFFSKKPAAAEGENSIGVWNALRLFDVIALKPAQIGTVKIPLSQEGQMRLVDVGLAEHWGELDLDGRLAAYQRALALGETIQQFLTQNPEKKAVLLSATGLEDGVDYADLADMTQLLKLQFFVRMTQGKQSLNINGQQIEIDLPATADKIKVRLAATAAAALQAPALMAAPSLTGGEGEEVEVPLVDPTSFVSNIVMAQEGTTVSYDALLQALRAANGAIGDFEFFYNITSGAIPAAGDVTDPGAIAALIEAATFIANAPVAGYDAVQFLVDLRQAKQLLEELRRVTGSEGTTKLQNGRRNFVILFSEIFGVTQDVINGHLAQNNTALDGIITSKIDVAGMTSEVRKLLLNIAVVESDQFRTNPSFNDNNRGFNAIPYMNLFRDGALNDNGLGITDVFFITLGKHPKVNEFQRHNPYPQSLGRALGVMYDIRYLEGINPNPNFVTSYTRDILVRIIFTWQASGENMLRWYTSLPQAEYSLERLRQNALPDPGREILKQFGIFWAESLPAVTDSQQYVDILKTEGNLSFDFSGAGGNQPNKPFFDLSGAWVEEALNPPEDSTQGALLEIHDGLIRIIPGKEAELDRFMARKRGELTEAIPWAMKLLDDLIEDANNPPEGSLGLMARFNNLFSTTLSAENGIGLLSDLAGRAANREALLDVVGGWMNQAREKGYLDFRVVEGRDEFVVVNNDSFQQLITEQLEGFKQILLLSDEEINGFGDLLRNSGIEQIGNDFGLIYDIPLFDAAGQLTLDAKNKIRQILFDMNRLADSAGNRFSGETKEAAVERMKNSYPYLLHLAAKLFERTKDGGAVNDRLVSLFGVDFHGQTHPTGDQTKQLFDLVSVIYFGAAGQAVNNVNGREHDVEWEWEHNEPKIIETDLLIGKEIAGLTNAALESKLDELQGVWERQALLLSALSGGWDALAVLFPVASAAGYNQNIRDQQMIADIAASFWEKAKEEDPANPQTKYQQLVNDYRQDVSDAAAILTAVKGAGALPRFLEIYTAELAAALVNANTGRPVDRQLTGNLPEGALGVGAALRTLLFDIQGSPDFQDAQGFFDGLTNALVEQLANAVTGGGRSAEFLAVYNKTISFTQNGYAPAAIRGVLLDILGGWTQEAQDQGIPPNDAFYNGKIGQFITDLPNMAFVMNLLNAGDQTFRNNLSYLWDLTLPSSGNIYLGMTVPATEPDRAAKQASMNRLGKIIGQEIHPAEGSFTADNTYQENIAKEAELLRAINDTADVENKSFRDAMLYLWKYRAQLGSAGAGDVYGDTERIKLLLEEETSGPSDVRGKLGQILGRMIHPKDKNGQALAYDLANVKRDNQEIAVLLSNYVNAADRVWRGKLGYVWGLNLGSEDIRYSLEMSGDVLEMSYILAEGVVPDGDRSQYNAQRYPVNVERVYGVLKVINEPTAGNAEEQAYKANWLYAYGLTEALLKDGNGIIHLSLRAEENSPLDYLADVVNETANPRGEDGTDQWTQYDQGKHVRTINAQAGLLRVMNGTNPEPEGYQPYYTAFKERFLRLYQLTESNLTDATLNRIILRAKASGDVARLGHILGRAVNPAETTFEEPKYVRSVSNLVDLVGALNEDAAKPVDQQKGYIERINSRLEIEIPLTGLAEYFGTTMDAGKMKLIEEKLFGAVNPRVGTFSLESFLRILSGDFEELIDGISQGGLADEFQSLFGFDPSGELTVEQEEAISALLGDLSFDVGKFLKALPYAAALKGAINGDSITRFNEVYGTGLTAETPNAATRTRLFDIAGGWIEQAVGTIVGSDWNLLEGKTQADLDQFITQKQTEFISDLPDTAFVMNLINTVTQTSAMTDTVTPTVYSFRENFAYLWGLTLPAEGEIYLGMAVPETTPSRQAILDSIGRLGKILGQEIHPRKINGDADVFDQNRYEIKTTRMAGLLRGINGDQAFKEKWISNWGLDGTDARLSGRIQLREGVLQSDADYLVGFILGSGVSPRGNPKNQTEGVDLWSEYTLNNYLTDQVRINELLIDLRNNSGPGSLYEDLVDNYNLTGLVQGNELKLRLDLGKEEALAKLGWVLSEAVAPDVNGDGIADRGEYTLTKYQQDMNRIGELLAAANMAGEATHFKENLLYNWGLSITEDLKLDIYAAADSNQEKLGKLMGQLANPKDRDENTIEYDKDKTVRNVARMNRLLRLINGEALTYRDEEGAEHPLDPNHEYRAALEMLWREDLTGLAAGEIHLD